VLKISQKLEYAMRATIELSARWPDGGLAPAREIATAQQIPLRFLEQQLGALHKAGLVESFRGAGGGCRLAKDPAETTNLADQYPDRVKQLKTRILDLSTQAVPPLFLTELVRLGLSVEPAFPGVGELND